MVPRLRITPELPRSPAGRAGADVAAAVLGSLRESWDEYRRWRKKFRRKPSRRNVHQLRTSIRRLSSQLDLVAGVASPKAAQKLRRRIGRELATLSEARDFQVQRERLASHHPEFLDWRAYRRFLSREIDRQLALSGERLRAWGTRRQRRWFDRIDRRLAQRLTGADARGRNELRACLRDGIGSALRCFEHLRVELRPGDHRSFHRLRLSVKDLTYKEEMVRALMHLPRSISERLPRLRRSLGKLQDEVAFSRSARKFLLRDRRHPHPRRELKRRLVRRESALLDGA